MSDGLPFIIFPAESVMQWKVLSSILFSFKTSIILPAIDSPVCAVSNCRQAERQSKFLNFLKSYKQTYSDRLTSLLLGIYKMGRHPNVAVDAQLLTPDVGCYRDTSGSL